MLSTDGNPTMNNLSVVFSVLKREVERGQSVSARAA